MRSRNGNNRRRSVSRTPSSTLLLSEVRRFTDDGAEHGYIHRILKLLRMSTRFLLS